MAPTRFLGQAMKQLQLLEAREDARQKSDQR